MRIGGQFSWSLVANLLQYPCAKKYRNTMWFDKVIAKIFLPHNVVSPVVVLFVSLTV